MNIKQLTLAVLTAVTGAAMAAMPEVSNVTMTQAANRLVTITYQITDAPAVVTLDIQTNANVSAAANDPGWTTIGGTAICNAQGDVWRKVGNDIAQGQTFSGTITWQPDQTWPGTDGNGFKIAANGARARVTAWPLDNTPDYMVVDLAAANTVRYYPGVDFLPGSEMGQKDAVTNNPAYKTSKLIMRKIIASGVEWTMGSADGETQRNAATETAHAVTLTNNYYIGVFNVTQAQWKNIAINSTAVSEFKVEGDMRPMERVSYNEIRNAVNTTTANTSYNWPAAPNPSSFLGLLRTKTGIDFDLPSEAQWEFAARAGHGSGYWNDGSAIKNSDLDTNLNNLGRYGEDNPGGWNVTSSLGPSAGGTANVGSYAPSDWGLYDMHGNVWEWCLDWYVVDITANNGRLNIDPSASANTLSGTTGQTRALRGGSWLNHGGVCRPACRADADPALRNFNIGFRLACTAGLR